MTTASARAWLPRTIWIVMALALAACSPIEPPRLGAGPPIITPKQIGTLGKPSVSGPDVVIVLDPLTNAPAQMLFSFEDSLKALAPSRQLKIVSGDDPAATYRLKGYLSAVGDSSSTLMVYVWDVFDAGGTRVHRISGQVTAPGSASDPWAGVTEGLLRQAASETIDALGNWAHS